jgi:excisionase family DNA binding protein
MTLRPLLRRVALYPGESLGSLLTRSAQANYCGSLSNLHKLFLSEAQAEDAVETRRAQIGWRPDVFGRLAHLTGLPAAELWASSIHHFAEALTPPGAEPERTTLFSGESVKVTPERFGNKKLRNESAAQYCPACLAERACHKLAWIPVMTAACLQHGCLLWDCCPKCHAKVSVETVVMAQCLQCHFPLSHAPVVDVRPDTLGLFAQTMLQTWLQVAPVPEKPWPYDLPDQPPLALYHFLDGLCSALACCDPAWLNEHAIGGSVAWNKSGTTKNRPPNIAYSLFATAFRTLVPWPKGFYEFLRAYALRDGQSQPTGRLEDDLGYFYGKTLEHRWKHPAFMFIQQAFNEFLISDYSAAPGVLKSNRYRTDEALAERHEGLTIQRAAQILGVGTPAIYQLILIGRLPVQESTIRGHYQLVRKADVRALRERWDDTLSLYETARWLGLAPDRVIDLAKAGALVVVRGPIAEDGQHWRFAKQAVCDLFDRVKQNVREPSLEVGKFLPLREASKIVAPINGNAAMLIVAVADGKLHAYGSQMTDYNFLNCLHFHQDDVEGLAQAVGAAKGWMGPDDIARRMGVKRTVITKWVQDGLLQPIATHANAQHFSQEAVEAFAAEHVFSDEAAQLLGVGRLTVQQWARNGRLKPVVSEAINGCHRYLFRRKEVERLRPKNRLTAPQLAKTLGLSRSQLSQWIKQGKVRPVSGPGVDGAKHYLFVTDEPQGGIA